MIYRLPIVQAVYPSLDEIQLAARTLREAMRDKSYRVYPMGEEAGHYLRWKRGRITPATYRDYEACLDKLARTFPDLVVADFEPPVGTERIEEFLDTMWGQREPRTYNKNLSIVKDFFKYLVLKGKLHGDPSLPLVPHRKRDVHRETFNHDAVAAIIANGPSPDKLVRDEIALRLLLKYGIRKGALQAIQFRHFDHSRQRLTIFTKGQKVRQLPIVDKAIWGALSIYVLENGYQPTDYLMCRRRTQMSFRGYDRKTGKAITERIEHEYPSQPMGGHGLHSWWYGCLERAGFVEKGQEHGARMHMARHTAGQRVLDSTGNLKAVQKLLGHASIKTTADVYTDWDDAQLAQTLMEIED